MKQDESFWGEDGNGLLGFFSPCKDSIFLEYKPTERLSES